MNLGQYTLLIPRQLDFFQQRTKEFYDWVPPYPYCSDDLETGCSRKPKDIAKQHRYIQSNGRYHHAIVVDCDYPNSFFADEDENYFRPNWTVQNQNNGHAHHFYCITPVKINDWDQTKSMRLLGKVQLGITRRLKGDLGFTHFLTKTLQHPNWRSELRSPVPYTLTELIGKLDPEEVRAPTKQEQAGLGRNCATFDRVRKWAYRAVLQHSDFQSWLNSCLLKVLEDNQRYAVPMYETECKALARSIAKWTFNRFSVEKFSEIQSQRGSKNGAKRRAALMPQVLLLKAQGLTQREISAHTGVAQKTISRWLAR